MRFNKVTIFLFLANLFIALVMISFLFRGVSPRTPKMVKWSSVESPGKAGDKLAGFLFPLLKESERINIQRDLEFSELFFKSFLKRARKEGVKTEIQKMRLENNTFFKGAGVEGVEAPIQQIHSMDSSEVFSIFIFQLKDHILDGFCKGANPSSSHLSPEDTRTLLQKICELREKALSQFNKKKRDPSFYWITMDRLEKNKALLFFQPPLKTDVN